MRICLKVEEKAGIYSDLRSALPILWVIQAEAIYLIKLAFGSWHIPQFHQEQEGS